VALKRLSAAEMISLSEPWVTPGHAEHVALSSLEDVRPALKRLARAHSMLLAAQPLVDPGKLSELQERGAELDAEHDDTVRGIVAVLSGFSHLTRDQVRKKAMLALRDTLFPIGGAIINKSYREEAGQGALLKGRLTGPMKSLLKSLPTPEGTLWRDLERYFRIAKELGEVEDAKGPAGEAQGPTAKALLDARNQWVRAVNALIAALDLLDEWPAEVTKLVERLRRAEAVADARAAGNGEEEGSGAAPAEEPEEKKGSEE
jgi:hypothetical protein